MSLESGNYLSNLVSSNPTGSDRKLQGDDHLRLIKSTLQNSFAGITGAVVVGGVNGGVANAYTLTPTPPLPSYVDNMSIVFSPTVANTAGSTINVSGLGTVSLLSVSGAALIANELVVGQKYRATFDGTNFRLFSVTKNYVDQLAFSSALPAQSLGFLASTGTVAAFTKTFNGYAVDESKGANVASASTIDLSNTAVTGNLVHVTGGGTINAITLPAGAERTIVFDGTPTLAHSANLDLPGAANIVVAVGDRAIVRGEGSGVTRVISFNKADGRAIVVTAPALVLLATVNVSAAANVDFLNTFSSTYDDYLVLVEGISVNAATILGLRFAIAGTADAGANYAWGSLSDTAGGVTGINQFNIGVTTTANQLVHAHITIGNINSAVANAKSCKSFGVSTQGGAPSSDGFFGFHRGANVATGFRLFWGSGASFNANGTVKVYGIAKV